MGCAAQCRVERKILGYRNAHLSPERVSAPDLSAVDAPGRVTDTELLTRLRTQQEDFVEFVRELEE